MVRLRVQRQDYYTDCDHANPDECHAIGADTGRPMHRYWMWHLVDTETGEPTDDGPFWSAREARQSRAQHRRRQEINVTSNQWKAPRPPAPDTCPECGLDLKAEGYPLDHQHQDTGRLCPYRWAPDGPYGYDEG